MAAILVHLLSLLAIVRCQSQMDSVCVKLQNFYDSICPNSLGGGVLTPIQGPPGKRGVPGQKGESGNPGLMGITAEIDYSRLDNLIARQLADDYLTIGTITNPSASCDEIKMNNEAAEDGLYYLKDLEGNVFKTFCSMNTTKGGWTLVASVHENNMKGRCTAGDRWSSEQGNSAAHPHGDGFWENRAIHGEATSATSDDYKNSGYFAMNVSDVMIWQVPNNTPMRSYATRAFFKYHTTNRFLQSYGGNLAALFSVHYNIRSNRFRASVDNGPAIPVVWDMGSNEELLRLFGSHAKTQVDAGFMQFRVVNNERNSFALCPGVKIKPGAGNVEHMCIGSTSYHVGHSRIEEYCGDFSAADWHYAGWSSQQKLIDSVAMIFYK